MLHRLNQCRMDQEVYSLTCQLISNARVRIFPGLSLYLSMYCLNLVRSNSSENSHPEYAISQANLWKSSHFRATLVRTVNVTVIYEQNLLLLRVCIGLSSAIHFLEKLRVQFSPNVQKPKKDVCTLKLYAEKRQYKIFYIAHSLHPFDRESVSTKHSFHV